jgi:hypothetical protein
MAVLDDVARFLAAKINSSSYPSQYLKTGVNLFLGRTPAEAPNSVVTIYEYAGQTPDFTMGRDLSALEFPRVQISVRGEPEDYPDAYAWAVLIRNTLGGWAVPDSVYFPYVARIEPMGVPNYTGFDEVNRPKFTMNFIFTTNATNGVPNV